MVKELFTTVSDIEKALTHRFNSNKYTIFNTYVYSWECDYFSKTTSGYAMEIEIKLSRADFKKDFTKLHKHSSLKNRGALVVRNLGDYSEGITIEDAKELGFVITDKDLFNQYGNERKTVFKHTACRIDIIKHKIPNRFYYACPEGLIQPDEVPEYAGLLWLKGHSIYDMKNAPLLHKEKHDFTSVLLDKFYHKSINQRHKIWELQREIKRLNKC